MASDRWAIGLARTSSALPSPLCIADLFALLQSLNDDLCCYELYNWCPQLCSRANTFDRAALAGYLALLVLRSVTDLCVFSNNINSLSLCEPSTFLSLRGVVRPYSVSSSVICSRAKKIRSYMVWLRCLGSLWAFRPALYSFNMQLRFSQP